MLKLNSLSGFGSGVSGGGVVTSTNGYILGGYTYDWETTVAEKFTFATETLAAATDADLPDANQVSSGVSDTVTNGYVLGGFTRARSDKISKLVFATDTTSALTSTLSVIRGGGGSQGDTVAGYVSGGWSSGYIDFFDKFTYSSETSAALTSVFDVGVGLPSGGSDGTTNGYQFGGHSPYTQHDEAFKLVYSTDVVSAITDANLSQARSEMTSVNSPLAVYILGGLATARVATADKMPFATEVTAAETSANLSQARAQAFFGSLGDGITGYVGGGQVLNNTMDGLTFATDTTAAIAETLSGDRAGMAVISDGNV
jgi:hypothetical protein